MTKIYLFLFSLFICNILAAQDQDYKIVRDISYTQSKDPYAVERCKLDLYYPENAKDFPTVVCGFTEAACREVANSSRRN